jgi:hypothetical protein
MGRGRFAGARAIGLSLGIAAGVAGGSAFATTPTTYVLTVASKNPLSGVAMTVTPADVNKAGNGTTSFKRTYSSGTSITLTAPARAGNNPFASWSGCTTATTVTCKVTLKANTTVTANYTETYVLTVDSANPAKGVEIAVTPAGIAGQSNGSTSFTRVYTAGTAVTLTAPAKVGNNPFASWSGCTTAATVMCKVTLMANTVVTAKYTQAYVLTVDSAYPGSGVAIGVAPADLNKAAGGTTDFERVYGAGAAVTLTAPAKAGGYAFVSWGGCTSATTVTCKATLSANQTVTAIYAGPATPTVTVTPAATKIATVQTLAVKVSVTGPNGRATPAGTVKLTSGTYTSAAQTLSAGSANLTIPAGSLATGSDTLTATYTPSTASSSLYTTAKGTSSPVTVVAGSAVTVDQSSSGPAVTDQLMGMNMAVWYDPTTPAIVPAFKAAGIKAVRWPGGSESDDYHWKDNSVCNGGYSDTNATYANFTNSMVIPGDLDVALTANYGTDAACTGPGDPTEAAAWAAEALAVGGHVSHITVGNEEYGSWETDLHAKPNDAATYASATANGYYPDIKKADPNVKVGVSVNPGNSPAWDPIVLANAKYDFVEYHYYPQGPGSESDAYLVQQAAQDLTENLKTIKAELATAGHPDTPIYVGEMGSVYTNPGKQSTSITQALYAGQMLGEMMNEGVSRATWWIGFGGCADESYGANFSASLYGWQKYGGYMVFSDGLPDGYQCTAETLAPGVLLPTARAYQLFSKVAVTGESVLSASVVGDKTDVRAYAATSSGGTALVLFNLNETASEPVVVSLSKETASAGVTVETYSKAIYDQSKNNVWAAPTTVKLGAQSLPLTLTLAPWSMNVVIIE